MSRMVVRNLGTTPFVFDRAGHQLGAGEFGVGTDTDHVTRAALADGKIGEVPRPGSGVDVDPAAAAAFAELDAGDDDGSGGAPADDGGSSDAPDGAAESSAAKTTTRKAGR